MFDLDSAAQVKGRTAVSLGTNRLKDRRSAQQGHFSNKKKKKVLHLDQ